MPEMIRYTRRDLWRRLLGSHVPDHSRLTHDRPQRTPLGHHFCQRPPGQAIPPVDLNRWTLLVDGLVARPLVLTYGELLAFPQIVAPRTVVRPDGALASADWSGFPLADLLAQAGVRPEAAHALLIAADDARALLPRSAWEEAFLAHHLYDEALRPEHGFPLRVLVPGRYEAGAFGWLKHIRLVAGTDPGTEAPEISQVHLRLDTPPPGARVRVGEPVAMQGVAFAGVQPITAVAISIDGGDGMPVTLRPPESPHVWTQWYALWTPAAPGEVEVCVRAASDSSPGGSEALERRVLSVR